ncbi:MAG: hypothetical protein OEZ48_06855 [Candidatus Bathyarchaeota archaeon]|nr:hypothetical protein [Candidatus Bathyarchaeota archaeon]
MSEEKETVSDLLKRIDELIDIFKILSEDMKEISTDLRNAIGAVKPEIPPAAPPRTIETPAISRTIDDIQRVFPRDLAGMLFFEESGENIIIKPRQYLGSDNFARIASIIRDELRGEYISAGRDSHFRVPRKT